MCFNSDWFIFLEWRQVFHSWKPNKRIKKKEKIVQNKAEKEIRWKCNLFQLEIYIKILFFFFFHFSKWSEIDIFPCNLIHWLTLSGNVLCREGSYVKITFVFVRKKVLKVLPSNKYYAFHWVGVLKAIPLFWIDWHELVGFGLG